MAVMDLGIGIRFWHLGTQDARQHCDRECAFRRLAMVAGCLVNSPILDDPHVKNGDCCK